jgi:transcriptional regulator with XRE-family HTH domain
MAQELDAAIAPAPFGARLRRLRRRAGLTQEALAERSGLSVDAISALERGFRKYPRRATLELLAGALELEPPAREAFLEPPRLPGRGPRRAARRVGARYFLLLLDDVEHLAPPAPVLADLLAGRPGLVVLVPAQPREATYGVRCTDVRGGGGQPCLA